MLGRSPGSNDGSSRKLGWAESRLDLGEGWLARLLLLCIGEILLRCGGWEEPGMVAELGQVGVLVVHVEVLGGDPDGCDLGGWDGGSGRGLGVGGRGSI